MIRAQLLLTPVQRQRLQQLAAREGRSLSDVARRALQIGLDDLEGKGEDLVQRRRAALAELAEIRSRIEERCGVLPGDLVAQVRAEREREIGSTWQNE